MNRHDRRADSKLRRSSDKLRAIELFQAGFNKHHAGQLQEAEAIYQRVIQLQPDHAEAYSNLGILLFKRGKPKDATVAWQNAINLKPTLATAHYNLGSALMQVGQLAKAQQHLEQAIRLDPQNINYRLTHAKFAPFRGIADHYLTTLEELARKPGLLSVNDRIAVQFALGAAYDGLGRHAEAFDRWLDGNALKRQQITYDETSTLGELRRVEDVFSSDLFLKWQCVGNPTSAPIFVIGMPRSGTTLIEQILASHPQVFGAGELMHFSNVVREAKNTFGSSAAFPELVSEMDGDNFQDLGSRYLINVKQLAADAPHITDKMPQNFIFLGLIQLALPNAPVIHVVRDAKDTCLSCFSRLFFNGQPYTYDLAELGRYYRQYQSVMKHWNRVLPPGRILNVQYEDVVNDLEGQARRILAYCGLDWDPRCLAFYETDRPVNTASVVEVRQPIYASAIGRWRLYEDSLGPLLTELDAATS